MRDSLTKKVAAIIEPTAFSIEPSLYGLKTEKELEQTMCGAVRLVAIDKARKILRLVRRNANND
jgi:hypothetical protein